MLTSDIPPHTLQTDRDRRFTRRTFQHNVRPRAPRLCPPHEPANPPDGYLARCLHSAEPFPHPPLLRRAKKAIGGTKNGKTREVPEVKAPKWYPADDIKPKVANDREAASRGVAKLKKSIKPGQVLIMLGGRFRGKRVVFLKQLASGLLLVTGPYQLNGVPLRRVNQAYCIATSASVDVKGADASKIDDAFFARTKKPKTKKDDEFFSGEEEVRATTALRLTPRKAGHQ